MILTLKRVCPSLRVRSEITMVTRGNATLALDTSACCYIVRRDGELIAKRKHLAAACEILNREPLEHDHGNRH